MRKFVVTGAAAFALAFAGVQPALAQQNMVGVKGGFVSANLSGDLSGLASRSAVGVGGFLQVMVGPGFSIQPEALYVMKGASEDGGDGAIKTNYLQVPVLVQYHFPAVAISPRLFAGPSLGFQMSCDIEEGGVSDSCENQGINTKNADFGLVFGAGVDVPLGGVVLTVDGRYDLGVTNVADEEGVDVKTKAWEFYAGLGFPFGP